jgi:serine/threonine-protein kinase
MAKLLGDSVVHTVSGVPIGTPLYMSPEQARGEKVDGRSDVYALGVLCHEMLTGRVPFTGESPLAVLVSHLTVTPPRASEVYAELGPGLDEAILHMLHKEPDGRPATASAAIAELTLAAERAGHVILPGMPHLPRPPALPKATPSTFSPRAPAEDHLRAAAPGSGEQDRQAMLDRTHPAPPRRRVISLVAALLAALAGFAVYLGRSTLQADAPRASSAPLGAASSPEPASALPVPVEPTVKAPSTSKDTQPARVEPVADLESPKSVQVVVRGAPRGARVSSDGKVIADASGPVSLPFGSSPVELTISAPGYEPQKLKVTPDQNSSAEVKLKKRAARQKAESAIPSDLESPF